MFPFNHLKQLDLLQDRHFDDDDQNAFHGNMAVAFWMPKNGKFIMKRMYSNLQYSMYYRRVFQNYSVLYVNQTSNYQKLTKVGLNKCNNLLQKTN